MSEELMQVVPSRVGRFLYYPTRASSLVQLRKAKVISLKVEKNLEKKRPDGLIVFPRGSVMAAIEYKQPKELKSAEQIAKAIDQERLAAKAICKLLIVTDNTKSFWINTINGQYICDANGQPIKKVLDVRKFQNNDLTAEEEKELESLLDNIDSSINAKNNKISAPTLLDPTPLAKSLWQRIWVSTGKEPEKCLYNVVELFVFKFLSDLSVLQKHLNFDSVVSTLESAGAEAALQQYAGISRKEIRKLFPPGDDGTTIINGTIFVNEKGEANVAQASLFGSVLELLHGFGRNVGSFKHIQREFKTRLYEAFLRQSAGTKKLGQYFTPRNVVRAMVEMSSADSLAKDARIGDPFCGVGGFLLETIVEIPSIFKQFEPKNQKVDPKITILGFDKGSDEKDDERTIILAKANMLIYFSDLIAKYHSADVLKEFSKNAFNKVFHLLRSNLGTFAKQMERPFDLILTNPPYVTSGVSSLRQEIEESGLSGQYTFKGRGTEALSIEWIIRNLAEDGQALVVVPDGLLLQTDVLRGIADHCVVQAIISLPTRTFYSTPKKTYILVIRKKAKDEGVQATPVFTYLVSEIGETRDSYRFPSDENDLLEAASLFRQFKGKPDAFQTTSSRFKSWPATEMLAAKNWLVDRLWTESEKRTLGALETASEISGADFVTLAKDAKQVIEKLANLVPGATGQPQQTATFNLGEPYIDAKGMKIGWMEYETTKAGWTKTEYRKLETTKKDGCKVYSAARVPVATVDAKHPGKIAASTQAPVISFAANGDGSAGTNFVFHTAPFYVSNDRTCIRITHQNIDPEYVMYALHGMKETYGFSHAFKATKENLGIVTFNVPLTKDGAFDLKRQQKMVKEFKEIFEAKAELESQLETLLKNRLAFGS
ncbi:N-6 DNA methylase [Burkholderia pseudomallei]|uniref:N-6 DNA methylase n=1 Tax=Burkholderia pseudomallei TaxID=28450 RepID=UPI0018D29BA7|nr:N-6 DNA methylase [Burkholderia pseudomallei]